ncbi:Lysine histidine transporter-like 8 [Rhynchospora pubera]|uniref:Lysine histidine transporter-like 8 n=1 Tax=Rhynchospora pubera TaxID=906938 RepID=A0AAV8CMU5_9POAL|nr:Lysine histidine transporter-like 8 [Rhynchospora pubera]
MSINQTCTQAAFGEKLGVWLALFPIVYLSAGTATALILIGGETMKLFFQISGAARAISYQPLQLPSFTGSAFLALNALGIIAFAFRGHNLALEIQAIMPSTFKHPAHVPMWRGTKLAYILIAMCLFPTAIGDFWAYGNMMPIGGMLNGKLYAFHNHDIPQGLLATTFLLVVFNCLSSFQIYSMPVFDSFEAGYTSRTNRLCSIWVRAGFRVFYGFISLFIGVALPFLSSLAGLLGGLTLPVTFAYPCFMWILIKKPESCWMNK